MIMEKLFKLKENKTDVRTVVIANIVTLTGATYAQSFQAALCIILMEGVIFLILSLIILILFLLKFFIAA